MPWLLTTVAAGTMLATTGLVAAQAPDPVTYLGRPIASVRLQIEGVPTLEPGLVDLVETRVGDALGMAAVRESTLHLLSLGQFEDIRVDVEPGPDGVHLVYELMPVHPVGDLRFEGRPGVSPDELRDAIRERFGRVPPLGRLEEMVGLVEQIHRDRGYVNAQVTVRPVLDHERERTHLVFDVRPGEQAIIGDVVIEVAEGQRADELRDALGLVRGRPFDRIELERRIEDYRAAARAEGYYLVELEYDAQVMGDGRAVDVVLGADRGPRVEVLFAGDPLPSRLESLVAIERETSIDEDLLEDASRRLESALNAEGYWRASVGHGLQEVGDALQVIFEVHRGDLFRLARLELRGNAQIGTAELLQQLTLTTGEPFVQERLSESARLLTVYYRRRGFVEATVQAGARRVGAEPGQDPPPMVVAEITIDEGVRTEIDSVEFAGNQAVAAAELDAQLALTPGAPFYQPDIVVSRDLILLHYLNRGHQEASVEARAEFLDDRERARIVFEIDEGPRIHVEHVLIVGNERIGSNVIQRELALATGDPLALDALIESQRRLRSLGVFRSVQINEIAGSRADTRDLLVAVEEAPATSVGYGGGLEAGRRLRRTGDDRAEEQLEFAPRGFFEIGRRNFWGKNRSIDLFTRISVRRDDSPVPDGGAGLGFNEYRVVGTFREPRPLGANAEFLASGFIEQAIRSSFNFNRRGVNAEVVRRLSQGLNVSGRYSFDRTKLFDERFNREERLLIDRLFPQVRLSKVSSAIIRDTRDDPLEPQHGDLLSLEGQLAARSIGSQVGFAKTLVQSFVYRRVPGLGDTVLALGGRLGVAVGFSRDVPREDAGGDPILDPAGQPIVDQVDDLPASERFFAGGDSTVRGFALDRLGTTDTIDRDGFPKGGNALAIFNAELRMPVWREVGAVVFLDAGNVFARASDLDLGDIRGSVGFGVRYRSPVGPIRLDLGYKLARRTFDNGAREPRTALHVSIGQAF